MSEGGGTKCPNYLFGLKSLHETFKKKKKYLSNKKWWKAPYFKICCNHNKN